MRLLYDWLKDILKGVLHHGTNVTGRITATGGTSIPFGPADSDDPPATSVAKVWPEPGASPGDTHGDDELRTLLDDLTQHDHGQDRCEACGDLWTRARIMLRLLDTPPAEMSSTLGLVPVNSEGLRRVVDALAAATRHTVLVELAEPLWLVRDAGDVWQLSRPWATRVNGRTGEIEHCTGFVGVSDVKVLKKGDRVWVRIV